MKTAREVDVEKELERIRAKLPAKPDMSVEVVDWMKTVSAKLHELATEDPRRFSLSKRERKWLADLGERADRYIDKFEPKKRS